MAYKLEISKLAQDDLKKLDKSVLRAVRKRLKRLAETVDEITHLPLKGDFAGLYVFMENIESFTIYNVINKR